jgi:hypothetical protein
MLSGSWVGVFSLVQFVAFFGPLIGLILGFDTINNDGKTVYGSIFRSLAVKSERFGGCALYHHSYSDYGDMLRDILHRVYATGNQIALIFTSNCILCKIYLRN